MKYIALHTPISKREQEILTLIAYEYTSDEIAKLLYISTNTEISHKKNLMRKLEVRNSAGLVRVGCERGLITHHQQAMSVAKSSN